MSHVERCKSKLSVGIDAELLQKAIAVTTNECGGSVDTTIDSRYQGRNLSRFNDKQFFSTIRTKQAPEGVGILLSQGQLEYARDYDGNRSGQKYIQEALERNYRALCMAKVLSDMQCHTITSSMMQNNIMHIQGVRNRGNY